MILDTFSICVTVVVLNVHFRSPQVWKDTQKFFSILKVSIVKKSIKINKFLDDILMIRNEWSLSLSILNTEEYKIEQKILYRGFG